MISNLTLMEMLRFLLPGFVAAWVFYGLTTHPRRDSFERTVQALVYLAFVQIITSFIKYVVFWIGQQTSRPFGVWTEETQFSVSCAVGLIFGLSLAFCVNYDIPHKYLRGWITKGTASPSEWINAFKKAKWVFLYLKDNTKLFGWPIEYPDNPDSGHFHIAEPVVFFADDVTEPRPLIHSILIPATDVLKIEFLKDGEERCTTTPEQSMQIQELLYSIRCHPFSNEISKQPWWKRLWTSAFVFDNEEE